MSTETPLADLYVRLGRLQRENEMLRAALANYTDVVWSVNDPHSFTPKVMDAGASARNAIAHRASCPGCPLCLPDSPSPVAYRDDLDTSTDGRKLP